MAKHRNRRRRTQGQASSAAAGSSSRPSSKGGPHHDGRDAMVPKTMEAEWKKECAVGPGIANHGNTCFFNAVVQCLASVRPLAQFLIKDVRTQGKGVGGDVLWSMKKLVEQVHQAKDSRAIDPSHFLKKMKDIMPDYVPGTEQCSAEFLQLLIDKMTKCLIDRDGSRKWETTLMGSLFGGHDRTQLECQTCKYTSDKFEYFTTLPLALDVDSAKPFTLASVLDHYGKTDTLKGQEGWKCHKCDVKRTAKCTTAVHKAPNVLVAHLKRFYHDKNYVLRKNTKFLPFPPELTLKTTNQEENAVYDLSGVIVHEGPTLFNGHYYCYVKTSTNTWAKKNDQHVTRATLPDVLGEKAYLLLYTQRAATRAQSAKVSAGNLVTRWGRGVLQRRRYRRILAAVRRLQAIVRGVVVRRAILRRRGAALKIQSVVRGLLVRAWLSRLRRAAVRLQACARRRAAYAAYRRGRLAATRVQALHRGRTARRQVAGLRKAARRRRTWSMLGGLIAFVVMAVVITAVAVALLFGGPSPCLRGNTIRGGDQPLTPGSCIEGATGSRYFGWIPGVAWIPTLGVTSDGDMVAQRPNGQTVKLTGHAPDGRSAGFLCRAERVALKLTGQGEPAYGARSAHGKLTLGKEYFCSAYRTPAPKGIAGGVQSWFERGGRLGFSALGDLEVVGPKGDVWWSLAGDLGRGGDSRWE